MPLARGRREVVQPFDLSSAQLDAVRGGVLLDACDPLRRAGVVIDNTDLGTPQVINAAR